jgi:Fe-S cluster assembly ATP-binding protein
MVGCMGEKLEINNLHVETLDGKKILQGITLTIGRGEIHAIMGQNGAGKSTLCNVLMGKPGYKMIGGSIILNGKEITKLGPDERARLGLFLGFQYPVEVAGVNFANFLRMALKNMGEKVGPIEVRQKMAEQVLKLGWNEEIIVRNLNEGFSGGEKKKAEILQMMMMKPKYAILDEPDSGVDMDSLNKMLKALKVVESKPGILLVTHYAKTLQFIKPDKIHILKGGKIEKTGGMELIKKYV